MARLLYLVRHAKSSWTDLRLDDIDRPLNPRGLRDAPAMGRRLKERNAIPDIILCSPARRTRETARLLIRALGLPENLVRYEEQLYEASPDGLLSAVRSLPDACASAMLIGHNPAIGWLVQELSGRHLEKMPTCAVATLETDVPRWMELETARLSDFDYPKKRHP